MDDSIKQQAMKYAEEKGLPADYVEDMLTWMSEHPVNTPPARFRKPIPEKLQREWIPGAVHCFQHFMPPINKPYSNVYFSTVSTFKKVRNKIIEEIQCKNKEYPESSIMEYIHGETGDAILIRRELLADIDNLGLHFNHLFWHELGHFYAINTESDEIHRYHDIDITDVTPHLDSKITMGIERKRQEGYCFWQKFIAEAISNTVSYKYRSSGSYYHPEQINWENLEYWQGIINRLDYLFEETFCHYTTNIDDYSLAHYYATILTDDLCMLYIKSADEGKVGINSEVIEPTRISDQIAEYQPALQKLKTILQSQLEKEKFWIVDTHTLEEIGSCIAELMSSKWNILSGLFS